MRRLIPVVLGLLCLPMAQAHGGDGFGHLNVDVADLAAGETKTYHLDPSNEGEMITLSQGWVFGVYGGVETARADLSVALLHDGISVANWTWGQGYHRNTTRLHFTGEYEIRVHNHGNATTRYALYYDQSCNCKGKVIPLPGGWNLFNYDLPAGRDVAIAFPMARTYHVRGALATLDPGSNASWPKDFRILDQAEAKGPQWLNFTFTTERADRYYVYIEAVSGATLQQPMHLTPLVEVESAKSPDLGLAGFLVLVATLALVKNGRSRQAR